MLIERPDGSCYFQKTTAASSITIESIGQWFEAFLYLLPFTVKETICNAAILKYGSIVKDIAKQAGDACCFVLG